MKPKPTDTTNVKTLIIARKFPSGQIRLTSKPILKTAATIPLPYLVYNSQLQSSNPTNTSLPRPTKFTKQAKQLVRDACAVMETDYDKNIAFITLTLPGSTSSAIATLALNSNKVLNGYIQRIRDAFHRHPKWNSSMNFDWVGVWEWQERGALHLHLAIAVPFDWQWKLLNKSNSYLPNYHHWWCQILETLSKKTGIDLFEQDTGGSWKYCWYMVRVQCDQIFNSISAYLSKQTSKNIDTKATPPGPYPRRWWAISKPLRQRVMDRREIVSVQMNDFASAEVLMDDMADILGEKADWIRSTNHPFTGSNIGHIAFYNPENHETTWQELQGKLKEQQSDK